MGGERRGYGQGTITERKTRDGVRYRARYPVNGKRVNVGVFDTREGAEGALARFSEGLAAMNAEAPVAGETLLSWSRTWLDEREVDGVHRDVKNDRYACRRWQLAAELSHLPLAAVTARDVRDWVAAQVRTGAAAQTIRNALNLLRVCLESACERGRLDRNPAHGVKVPRIPRTAETWTWLTPPEVALLLAGADEDRDAFAAAVYTGLRAGELFGLERTDVDLDHGVAVIRQSWKGRPTKRGEARRVSLLAPALEALERQLARHKHRHVFPARDGSARSKDQIPDLAARLEAVGIARHVRFHDLRHTCASALLQGVWAPHWIARPLRLEEVSTWLGHRSFTVTQRYAHLCPEGVAGLVVRNAPPAPRVVPMLQGRTARGKRR